MPTRSYDSTRQFAYNHYDKQAVHMHSSPNVSLLCVQNWQLIVAYNVSLPTFPVQLRNCIFRTWGYQRHDWRLSFVKVSTAHQLTDSRSKTKIQPPLSLILVKFFSRNTKNMCAACNNLHSASFESLNKNPFRTVCLEYIWPAFASRLWF